MGESILVRRSRFTPDATSFALIKVTYTQNAFCTCSKGTIILSSPDRSGQCTFIIPEVGTWTITCTDGANTNSKTVTITSEGQVETVTVNSSKYTYFYNRGIQNVPWSWDGTSVEYNDTNPGSGVYDDNVQYGKVSFGTDRVRLYMDAVVANSGYAKIYTTNAVDLTDINTLYVVTSGGTGDTTYIDRFGIGETTSILDYGEAGTIIPKSDSELMTSLDVSSFSGTHQIYVEHWNYYAYLPDLYVYEVYGE